MATSKKYEFRVSETRHPALFKWLESLPEGDRSFWIIKALDTGVWWIQNHKEEKKDD